MEKAAQDIASVRALIDRAEAIVTRLKGLLPEGTDWEHWRLQLVRRTIGEARTELNRLANEVQLALWRAEFKDRSFEYDRWNRITAVHTHNLPDSLFAVSPDIVGKHVDELPFPHEDKQKVKMLLDDARRGIHREVTLRLPSTGGPMMDYHVWAEPLGDKVLVHVKAEPIERRKNERRR
jgi:hypothetical protein